MISLCTAGIYLVLAEICQRQNRVEDALACLRRLRESVPEDVVVMLSLAELLSESGQHEEVIELLAGLQNRDYLHAGCLLYLGKAFRAKGLYEAAATIFTQALRRKKERPAGLLQQIRYERGCTYLELGRKASARRDLERLYAENPNFKDLKSCLRRLKK